MILADPVALPWVTFDLDNTLLASPYWRLHFLPWLRQEAQRRAVPVETLRDAFYQEAERLWASGQWVDSFDWTAIADHLGLSPLPPVETPHPSLLQPLVLPGAEKMLQNLRALRIKIGLVTNGFTVFQQPYLGALGWNQYFDAVIGPDIAGAAKPDPRIMDRVTPGLVHVGDRLTHDVLVAHRTHRRSVWMWGTTPEHDRLDPAMPVDLQADYRLASFDDLPPLVLRLLVEHEKVTG